jgi:hypothetical protein
MRAFELLIIGAILPYLMWLSFGNGLPTSMFRWLPFLAAGIALIHLLLEGARWQMTPLYLLVILVLASYPWCQSHSFRIRLTFLAIGWAAAFLLLAPAAVAGGVLWPVFEFVPLTGTYPVGTVSAHLIDRGRLDPYSPSRSATRELMVQVWYPAEATHGFRHARYRDGRRSDYKDSSMALVETRSFADAPIARTQPTYPVLLFTGPMNRFQNTFETEEMSSQGFIVVAIDHTYESDLVVFPDGRRIPESKEAGLLDFTSDDALAVSRQMVERRLAVRVADTLFVLDELERWNQSDSGSRFFGRLDLGHIGIIGHSFGGAVAAEVCRADPRVRAGVNMDGSIFGTVKTTGVPKPFIFMFDATPRPTKAELESPVDRVRREALELDGDYADIDRSMRRYGSYFLQVPGLEHMNYTDFPLHSQLKAWTGAGAIDIRRAHQLTNRLTLAFFRRELLGDPGSSPEAAIHDYPEATLCRHSTSAGVTCGSGYSLH